MSHPPPTSTGHATQSLQSESIRPLRIVYVAPFGLRHKTTVWARTLPLAQELVRRGHTATIVVPPWDSPEDAGQRDDDQGVHIAQVELEHGLPATIARMLAAIDAQSPDIIHIVKPRAHAGIVQFLLWQRRRLARIGGRAPWRLVLDVDDWEQAWAPINRYAWPIARFMAWQEEWGMRHADGFTAASHWLYERLAQVAPQRPRLYLPNGVSAPPARPHHAGNRAESQGPNILFFSRFIEVEPAWLAAYWRAMRTLLPHARLLIAGAPVQPQLGPPFQAALADLPGIEWLGYIPQDELATLYGRVACAIFPAAPVPLHQAKCSVRLATTLLHGVPVVASAVGEQAYYGADGIANLVPADAAPEAFAAATLETIQRPDEAQIAQGQALLRQRYAWSRLTQQLESFYAALYTGR